MKKILFIDRDGTLIHEPEDKQIDSLHKFHLEPNVIPALLQLKKVGFHFVMVSNQDGLGTDSLPQEKFDVPHKLLLDIFKSQGIEFEAIKICPHLPSDGCECRKPRVGLVLDYLRDKNWDRTHSFVIGDRDTDGEFAIQMGIGSLHYDRITNDWDHLVHHLMALPRRATKFRRTKETAITVTVDLDNANPISVNTGIGFFDHMLEQLAKHGGFSLETSVSGDLHIDEHHTVEDTAITLGEAIREALGDKIGIARYGFLLPMDETLTQAAIDLSGRPYLVFEGKFDREEVGGFSTEMVKHFFQSFAGSLGASLNLKVEGENTHHMVESLFKATGRALRMAVNKSDEGLPSTKGVL